jgi:hypothetical protein
MVNWSSNLIVSMTFLSLTEALGSWATFLLYAAFSLIGLIAIFLLVPETIVCRLSRSRTCFPKGSSCLVAERRLRRVMMGKLLETTKQDKL